MANSLNFISTYTVEEFLDLQKAQEIKIKSHEGKLFMAWGSKTAPVSRKGTPQSPIISLVHETREDMPSEEVLSRVGKSILKDGKRVSDPLAEGYFFLLHEEEGEGCEVVAHLNRKGIV